MGKYQYNQEILEVTCPTCGAPPKERCRYKTGNPTTRSIPPHESRFLASKGINPNEVVIHTDEILAVSCSYCGASPGQKCRPKGDPIIYRIYPPHKVRLLASLK